MTEHSLGHETKRAFRAVMREMNGAVRFDTPEELGILRTNFQTARKRSLMGIFAGGAACGLGWRYTVGRRYSALASAWGAFAGMTLGMFSVRQELFLDLLSIPEDRSPFAHRARAILDKEMPQSPLMMEIQRRRRKLFPRADDRGFSYDEIVWTEPPPSTTFEESFDQHQHHRVHFPSEERHHQKHLDPSSVETGDWTLDTVDDKPDSMEQKKPTTWEELRRRASGK